ncbi:ABC transporter ATP-binding protein, partial [Candidatus Collierbacteria bacterium]|nr:ABC transporter ATP-binding protein [Candidatus Collierbacteria bacterium]
MENWPSYYSSFYPLINRSLIDLISEGSTTFFLFKKPTFVNLILLLFTIKVFLTLMNRLSMYASSLLSIRLRHHLREVGFKHLLKLSIGFYNRNQSGRVMSKLSRGTDGIRQIISNFGIHLLPSAVTAIFSIIIVASINWKIGLITSIVFIPFFFLRKHRFNQINKIEERQNRIWDREYSHFWEVLANIRLVKTFAAEKLELNKFGQIVKKLIKNNYRIEAANNRGVVADLLVDIWTLAIYAYVIYLGLTKAFTVGTVVLMVQYIEMIKQPLWNLGWIFWEVKYAQIGIRDFMKILDKKPDLEEINRPINLTDIKGKVEFKNVWFKYPEKGGQDVFHGVSFSVQPGKTLALVGKSGVGKTTIAHLLV